MHCFHGFVEDFNKPGDSIMIGAGIHDLCVDINISDEFWQLTTVKKV